MPVNGTSPSYFISFLSEGVCGRAAIWSVLRFFGLPRIRRALLAVVLLGAAGAFSNAADGEVDVYLDLEEAPRAVFPEADSFERKDVPVDDAMRRRMKKRIGRLKPSIWEPFYITYTARKNGKIAGYAVIAEEIGKHRPITFIVGVTPQGEVQDVALMMYREPVGDEVRYEVFLKQFDDKRLEDPIFPRRDIKNITGATLSVRAMSRGVRKVLAFVELAFLQPSGARRGASE